MWYLWNREGGAWQDLTGSFRGVADPQTKKVCVRNAASQLRDTVDFYFNVEMHRHNIFASSPPWPAPLQPWARARLGLGPAAQRLSGGSEGGLEKLGEGGVSDWASLHGKCAWIKVKRNLTSCARAGKTRK